jgi:hypothetical protein
LLTGGPVTPFRGAALTLFGRQFPLMVQDYIGALNVYLALPFLALTGIGAPNLRALALLTGLAALLLMERAVSTWQQDGAAPGAPTWGGVVAVWLLAASPSFVFWSRQGIFVTNLMQPFVWLMIWQGLRWLHNDADGVGSWRLVMCALGGGLALYAKLMALWVVGPFYLLLAVGWLARQRQEMAPPLHPGVVAGALAAFIIPLLPLVLFNLQTGGVWTALAGNAVQSYYGVDNRALLANAGVRLTQLGQSLRGDHFWYLGALYGNWLAPWLAAVGIGLGLVRRPRRMLPALALLAAVWAAGLITISDLFITHYALLQPLVVAVAAGGLGSWLELRGLRRVLALALVALWVMLDLSATLRYHQALARSGGLAGHSDASYHLAYYLRHNGLAAPVALDWGIDAPVRFLSENQVRPIEIFGYGSPAAPGPDFSAQLTPFLANPDNVYLLHAPEQTVFQGRRTAFLAEVEQSGQTATLVQSFLQRDGTPLYELWRVAEE